MRVLERSEQWPQAHALALQLAAAPANALPTNGPVQEKDTIANVAAMKKMPMSPPRSAA